MNSKQAKTLKAIFTDPIPANIAWKDIVTLFEGLGVTVTQGRGSRVRVMLNQQRAVFHEPHPERVADKGVVKSVREFLVNAGITLGEGD
ncbi:MAG: type II toxin-antitoxin system HicA family toxin [Acaryochloris sp. RU_4_1]|nr:type II toxin-antitoxin system HicA family toxin [Acaryochloris sp. RU_4_1]NJN38847.1 type II toxin-antitoxin system HicA family toxin [Acaryochloridaceae cyanobacterium CSU_3_4]NJR53519.1 type II toxin-antitoxin system HicA family toxin [Acaryochloris sp. CRU_2_0]